ncbi:CdaR family protein [Brachyspira innocens]|uniref:CdaR family protein n=1 Tax=Brachyspira innocens TaxID=13264 RepID=A0ABT8YWU2_9SPIR|nr:CdaR family protein [Brachyspira innocens]MDO6993080.1 CdaR family protein [Brachyspira innocens]MDO7019609.1 CdaR family protein [Brachyspira innocens]
MSEKRKTEFKKKFSYKKVLYYITNRFWIKLLCLLMSFLLFLFVRYQKEYTKDYITKIEIKNIPSRLLIANQVPENVTITLKGFKDNVYELPTEFSAYIDLTNASIGSNMYEIYLAGDIDYSKMNITVSPSKLPIVLDELAYKTVPIEVPTIGVASLGLSVDDIIVNPSNTIISGPKSLISSIDEIKTYNLDLTDKYLDYSAISRLNLPRNIKSDVSRVNVNVIFNKDVERMEFNNIAVNIDNLNSRFNINSDSAFIVNKVVLEANKVLLTNVSLNDILLSIDLKDITNAGVYSNISVEANIPIHTKLVQIEPSYFDVEVIDRESGITNMIESTNEEAAQ